MEAIFFFASCPRFKGDNTDLLVYIHILYRWQGLRNTWSFLNIQIINKYIVWQAFFYLIGNSIPTQNTSLSIMANTFSYKRKSGVILLLIEIIITFFNLKTKKNTNFNEKILSVVCYKKHYKTTKNNRITEK